MIYTKEVENMCPVAKGAKHEPAPIPEEGKWVHSKKIEDISGFTHGVGSVSYTHLDVYKRQRLRNQCCGFHNRLSLQALRHI